MILTALGWWFLGGAVLVVLVQACFVFRLVWLFRHLRSSELPAEQLPAATVVVALRGADPYLAENLRSLMHQDYPRFEIRVVVDHPEDPAWPIVQALQAEDGGQRLRVELLAAPRKTCSLKNSALAQALRKLDPSCEVVAFFDGDVGSYRHWLRDLVAPLRDPSIGVTTGYRWYHSPQGAWGSLARYLWNAGAAVQIWLNRMVWAGSMAVRTSVIRDVDLPSVWEQAISTDGPMYAALKQKNYRVAFVPQVMMLTRDEITVARLTQWLQRQMMVAHLYHPGFNMVILQAVTVTATQLLALGLFGAGLWTRQGTVAACAAGSLGVYWGACLLFTGLLEWGVRAALRAQGLSSGWLRPVTWLRLLGALLITHVLFPYTLLRALRRKTISWRGIRYRISGPWQIRMVRYRPYRDVRAAAKSQSVL